MKLSSSVTIKQCSAVQKCGAAGALACQEEYMAFKRRPNRSVSRVTAILTATFSCRGQLDMHWYIIFETSGNYLAQRVFDQSLLKFEICSFLCAARDSSTLEYPDARFNYDVIIIVHLLSETRALIFQIFCCCTSKKFVPQFCEAIAVYLSQNMRSSCKRVRPAQYASVDLNPFKACSSNLLK